MKDATPAVPASSLPVPDLAALLGSRLCHDLVSPLGAIGNGVELLALVAPISPELDLVAQAVASAQARLRLFRLAFGAASTDQSVRATDLLDALSALESNGRVTLRSRIDAPLPRLQARRLALAVLCAESALAWGGTIDVSARGIDARAPRLRLEADLWAAIAAGTVPTGVEPGTVHFALLANTGPVGVRIADDGVTLTL